jgi:hypothetical protein
MTKTMSIRRDRQNYEFLRTISREERGDLSKAVRDLGHAAESYLP